MEKVTPLVLGGTVPPLLLGNPSEITRSVLSTSHADLRCLGP